MATATDSHPGTGEQVTHARTTVHPEKAAAVAEIAESFRSSTAAVLTEYRGLSVKQISELRVALGADTSYAVVKNTLTKIAARDAGIDGLDELLQGPTAVAFIKGEPVEAAKALRTFAKANPVLIVKGGLMDGQALSPADVSKLADLESREILLGKMAGALLASLSNAVYLLNAPLAQAARVLGALQAKAEADPSVLGGGAGTPEAATPEAVAADAGVDTEGADEVAAPEPAGAEAVSAEDVSAEAVPAEEDGGTPEAVAAEGITPAETDEQTEPPA